MSKKIFVPPRQSIREYVPDNLTDEDFELYDNDYEPDWESDER